MSKLILETEGEKLVVVRRRFEASPDAVYRAHIEPELIQQWMLGPDGWTMPVCVKEARPGGRIRYEWSDGKGGGFYLTGEIVELDPPHRLVHVERMHLREPTPDNHIVTTFTPDGSGTLMTLRHDAPGRRDPQGHAGDGDGTRDGGVVRAARARFWREGGRVTSLEPRAGERLAVHLSIDVPNLEHGLRFYGRVFGLSETSRPFAAMAILDAGNVTVCMHEQAAGTRSSPGGSEVRRYERHWTPVHLDVHVADLDAVNSRTRESVEEHPRRLHERSPGRVVTTAEVREGDAAHAAIRGTDRGRSVAAESQVLLSWHQRRLRCGLEASVTSFRARPSRCSMQSFTEAL